MKIFACQKCGNLLHFENTSCIGCGTRVGYVVDKANMSAVVPNGRQWTAAADTSQPYVFCANAASDVCNWLVPADADTQFCVACALNRTIPDLAVEGNLGRWAKLEGAKRHLAYSLMRLGLPLTPLRKDSPPLIFDLIGDTVSPQGRVQSVLTGHYQGVITINIAEADDAERERRRIGMGEPYRTLLGHFRHEVGHYYWDILVSNSARLQEFRKLFGDESSDYGAALAAHYASGPPAGWQQSTISAYAAAHPLEDFAETFAHYLHIVDALETAHAYGLRTRPRIRTSDALEADVSFEPYAATNVADLLEAWVPLTVALNSVNRSMGQPDLYPFVLSQPVVDKLGFVNSLIHGRH